MRNWDSIARSATHWRHLIERPKAFSAPLEEVFGGTSDLICGCQRVP